MIANRQWLLDWTGLLHKMTPNNMAAYTRPTDTIPEGMPIQMEENFNPTHRYRIRGSQWLLSEKSHFLIEMEFQSEVINTNHM